MKRTAAVFVLLAAFVVNAEAEYYRYEDCASVASTYPWHDISTSGTTLSLADDATSAAVNIGFTFNFGGTNYTQLRVGSNGWLFFGGVATTFANTALPAAVDAVLMPYWDDFNPNGVATRVRYQTLGSAPNRTFVVSYLSVPHYCGGGTGCAGNETTALLETFQVQLHETSNEVIFSYDAMSTLGGGWTTGPVPSGGLPETGATIGVEVSNSDYTQHSFNTDSITSNSAIRFFSYPTAPVCSTTGTRLYMQNAVPDVTVATHRGAWDDTASVLERKLSRTKVGSIASLGVVERSNTNNYDVLILKLVSEPITSAQTISGTLNWVVGSRESNGNMNAHWHVHAYVTVGDTDTVRGTLYNDYTEPAGTNEWPTTAVGDTPTGPLTLSPVAISANDRIVIEAGYVARNTQTAPRTGTLWYGGTSVSDLSAAGNETAFPGYWEFSQNLFPPVTVDHYELLLPTGSITCLPTTVTVRACADTSSPCTNLSTSINGQTATLSAGAGSLGATTVTFDAGGVASTTLSYPAASDGATATVTLSGETTTAANPRQCCPNGVGCAAGDFCSTTFNTAGFIFSAAAGGAVATVPTQTAGISSATYYLRAVRTSTTTQQCESALAGAQSVDFAYECNNPTTCSGADLMSVNGGASTVIQRNDNGSALSYTSVNMTFDVNGNAPFTFNFGDVGLTTLHANGTVNSATLTGSTNAFVVRPDHFDLSGIGCTTADSANCAPGALLETPSGANPAAANASEDSFIQAGNAFSVTVTARDANNNATPNYGQETVAEGVTLARNVVVPAAGVPVAPALSNASAFGSFANGVATGTTFAWNEVGIITLTPSVGDGNYLGAGNVSGTTSGNVGRFIPAFFDVTHSEACSGGAFTYSGQPFASVTVTPGTASGGPINYYQDGYGLSRTVTVSDAGDATNFNATNLIAPSAFTGTSGSSSSIVYTYPAKETVPTAITLRAVDTDMVSSSGHTEATPSPRSGRIQIQNAFGSELLDLAIPMRAQYYTANGWVTNAQDTCTGIAAANLTLNGSAGPGPVAVGGGTTTASVANNPMVAGDAGLLLSAPDADNTGNVDIGVDLSAAGLNMPWLQFDWDGTAGEDNPQGRATFGIYRGSPRQIHIRERY